MAQNDIKDNAIHDERLYINNFFGVKNYLKYQKDLIEKKFTKICMTEIINSDIVIATFGENVFGNSVREVLQNAEAALGALGYGDKIFLYAQTYRNFILAANDSISDQEFTEVMRGFYEQFERSTSQSLDISGISRFALAFGDDDLVHRVKSAHYFHRNTQNNFIIASDEREKLMFDVNSDIDGYELVNYAINNNKVVPFYQGIYDAEQGKITKYEALMRVFNHEGKMYTPYAFLDVAKTYKLYKNLSMMLIDRALYDFDGKEASLSINLSLYDVEDENFTTWFFERLEKFKHPERLIIEFVETENYNKGDKLYHFLNRAREKGVKIAVDDFGVGFATYTSIISLRPEIIKIDGDIIKDLDKNPDNKLILESICYMADLIGSQTVAEFVENEEIEKIVISEGIHFLQGYYYAKPERFENLDIK